MRKSTANIRLMSFSGMPTAWRTITMLRTMLVGMLAAPIEAAVAVKLYFDYKILKARIGFQGKQLNKQIYLMIA